MERLYTFVSKDIEGANALLLSELASKVADCRHDMKEPLRNISNFLQLVRCKLCEEYSSNDTLSKMLKYIDHAIKNVNVLNKFGDSIFPSDDINKKNITEFSLVNIIRDIELLIHSQIKIKKCKIIYDNDIPHIKCVYLDVLRVFKNLIENSLRHAVTQNLKINITFVSTDDLKTTILFQDNGKKLSERNKNIIEHVTNDGYFIGSRGLTICRDILTKYSCSIKLVKGNNEGVAYEISLPIDEHNGKFKSISTYEGRI